MPTVPDMLAALRFYFAPAPQVAVAYSGGVDSALLAFIARRQLGRRKVCAYMADSPSLKRGDLVAGKAFAARHDIPLEIVRTGELDDPQYAKNPDNRCYFCKSHLYARVLAEQVGTETWVCNGANRDDAGDYRPGMLAAAERSVRAGLEIIAS